MGLLVLGCSLPAGGCVEAITDGAAVGLRDSIAATVRERFADVYVSVYSRFGGGLSQLGASSVEPGGTGLNFIHFTLTT